MPLSKAPREVFDETYIKKNPLKSFLGQHDVTILHFDDNTMFFLG
jgi:hypothetical protein